MAQNTELNSIHAEDGNEYETCAFVSDGKVCVSVRLTNHTAMYFNSEAEILQFQAALAEAINKFNAQTVKMQELLFAAVSK